ncbi:Transmembrane protein [Globisporangium polare]
MRRHVLLLLLLLAAVLSSLANAQDAAATPDLLHSTDAHAAVDSEPEPTTPATIATTSQTTALTFPTSDVLFQYMPVVDSFNWTELLNVTQYNLPAFAYETDWAAIGTSFQDACVGTYEFLRLWVVFLWLVCIPMVQAVSAVAEALLPHFITLVKIGVEYVLEMDPVHQAAVALTSLFVVVCIRKGYFRKIRIKYLLFKRNVELRYRSFLASLGHTSRAIAILLPHAAFFLAAYALLFWSPELVVSVWDNESLLSFFAVGYPLIRTVMIIRHRRIFSKRPRQPRPSARATEASTRANTATVATTRTTAASRLARSRSIEELVMSEWRPYETILKYWVLWSFAGCLLSFVSLFLPRFVVTFVTVPTYVCNIFFAWIHSPVTRGDIALYTLLSPLFNPYANRIRDTPATAGANTANRNENEAANFLMRTLVMFRVLPEHRVHLMKDLWSQGPALGGLMFIFTPGFVTARGCWLAGFGFPAYVTMGALAEKTTRRYEWWLSYFCVAVAVDYLVTALGHELAWLPLFYHAKLLLLMWLQFPYFRGAQRIFDASFASIFVIPDELKED